VKRGETFGSVGREPEAKRKEVGEKPDVKRGEERRALGFSRTLNSSGGNIDWWVYPAGEAGSAAG